MDEAWLARVADDLEPHLPGTVLVIGASDTGKTTVCRHLTGRLRGRGVSTAYLDCDAGQSTVGPPCTIGLDFPAAPDVPRQALFFLGDTTPRGNVTAAVVGAARLQRLALARRAEAVVVDTSGLVEARADGVALKLWKAEALQPSAILALQRADELAPIIAALVPLYGRRLLVREPSRATRPRAATARRARRQELWRRYFEGATECPIRLAGVAVWGGAEGRPGRVVGLDGHDGLCLGLGVVLEWGEEQVRLVCPPRLAERPARLRAGRLFVEPGTGHEWR